MKTTITILIVAVATIIGWQQRNALNQLHAEELVLISTSTDPAFIGNPGGATHTAATLKTRADTNDEARTAAKNLIVWLKEGWKPLSVGFHILDNRADTVTARMNQLDSLQLRVLIEQLRNDPDIDDTHRNGAIRTAAICLSDLDPTAAMTILSGMDGMDGPPGDLTNKGYDYVIGKWASTDPLAALAWMRENRTKVNKYQGGRAFVIGLAAKDPKLAFQSLIEFEAYDLHGDGEYEGRPDFSAAEKIARTARTLEDRTVMLGILRELADHAGDDPDYAVGYTCEHALHVMAEGLATYESARTITWLKSLEIRPTEAAELLQALRNSKVTATGGAGKWQQENQQAVEKWLTENVDGPAKRPDAAASTTTDPARQAEPENHPEPTPGTYPVAVAVDGRPGFVTSPFTGKIIEVNGVPSGTLIADPSCPAGEKKYFRVP